MVPQEHDPTLILPLPGEGTDITPQKLGSKVPPPGKGEVRRGSGFLKINEHAPKAEQYPTKSFLTV